jgi:hypothetical protein
MDGMDDVLGVLELDERLRDIEPDIVEAGNQITTAQGRALSEKVLPKNLRVGFALFAAADPPQLTCGGGTSAWLVDTVVCSP